MKLSIELDGLEIKDLLYAHCGGTIYQVVETDIPNKKDEDGKITEERIGKFNHLQEHKIYSVALSPNGKEVIINGNAQGDKITVPARFSSSEHALKVSYFLDKGVANAVLKDKTIKNMENSQKQLRDLEIKIEAIKAGQTYTEELLSALLDSEDR